MTQGRGPEHDPAANRAVLVAAMLPITLVLAAVSVVCAVFQVVRP